MTRPASLHVKRFGLRDYPPVFELMQSWSARRLPETTDQLWLLEHSPIYTQGRNGKPEHVLNPGNIPIVQVDRGGQVTYHGPGQLMVYLMLDVKRGGWGIRQIVSAMERAVIDLLRDYGVHAFADKNAPGVYVEQGKISALGLRVKNGRSYHGLSLNLDMDLAPFSGINPCGYAGMKVVRLVDLVDFQRLELEDKLVDHLANMLGFSQVQWDDAITEVEINNV